jgi:hypothetical protein
MINHFKVDSSQDCREIRGVLPFLDSDTVIREKQVLILPKDSGITLQPPNSGVVETIKREKI